jgi:hypothetical protein
VRQALHIFRKDVRQFRWELGLLLALFGLPLSGWEPSGRRTYEVWSMVAPLSLVLLVALVLLLPGRIVHAEALPGDRQFWLTRPYSWKSLLGAKCLFVMVFVVAPMTLADALNLTRGGFAVSPYLPGLVWEQILRGSMLIAPALALGAITRNVATQIFTALALAAMYVFLYATESIADPNRTWAALGWVYHSITLGLVLSCSVGIVVWQYARRTTFAARIVFGIGTLVVGLVPLLSASMAMAIQQHGSKNIVDPSAIHVALDPPMPVEDLGRGIEDRPALYRFRLPLRISGVPEGYRMWADQIHFGIQGPRGGMNRSISASDGDGSWVALDNSHAVVTVAAGSWPERWTVHMAALITLGGNRRSVAFRSGGPPVLMAGLGSCSMGASMSCKFPFRGAEVIASLGSRVVLPSYSPFPAELTLDPAATNYYFAGREGQPSEGGTLILEDPVQHFFLEVEFDDVRLADYAVNY